MPRSDSRSFGHNLFRFEMRYNRTIEMHSEIDPSGFFFLCFQCQIEALKKHAQMFISQFSACLLESFSAIAESFLLATRAFKN